VNPFPLRSAAVTITTMDPAGKQLRLSQISLAPGSRVTLDMQKLVGTGRHVTSVVSTNGVQVVAEQTIYFNGQWGGAGAPGIAPS
jgi:hypothetical protein